MAFTFSLRTSGTRLYNGTQDLTLGLVGWSNYHWHRLKQLYCSSTISPSDYDIYPHNCPQGSGDFPADFAQWMRGMNSSLTRTFAISPWVNDDTFPWLKVGGKYDLTQYDPTFLANVKAMAAAFADQGAIFILDLFDSAALHQTPTWVRHPWHPNQAINSPITDLNKGTSFIVNPNQRTQELQKDYVRYMVRELRSYKNVIFEVCNEYFGGTDWHKLMAKVIKGENSEVLVCANAGVNDVQIYADDNVDITSVHGGQEFGAAGNKWFAHEFAAVHYDVIRKFKGYGKPVLLSTDGSGRTDFIGLENRIVNVVRAGIDEGCIVEVKDIYDNVAARTKDFSILLEEGAGPGGEGLDPTDYNLTTYGRHIYFGDQNLSEGMIGWSAYKWTNMETVAEGELQGKTASEVASSVASAKSTLSKIFAIDPWTSNIFPWAEEGGRFNLNSFNATYMTNFKDTAAELAKKGVIVLLSLYDYRGMVEQWSAHPLNAANSNSSFSTPLEVFANDAIHEAYITHMLTSLVEYKNVIFEICNEAPYSSRDWQSWIASKIKAENQTALVVAGVTPIEGLTPTRDLYLDSNIDIAFAYVHATESQGWAIEDLTLAWGDVIAMLWGVNKPGILSTNGATVDYGSVLNRMFLAARLAIGYPFAFEIDQFSATVSRELAILGVPIGEGGTIPSEYDLESDPVFVLFRNRVQDLESFQAELKALLETNTTDKRRLARSVAVVLGDLVSLHILTEVQARAVIASTVETTATVTE